MLGGGQHPLRILGGGRCLSLHLQCLENVAVEPCQEFLHSRLLLGKEQAAPVPGCRHDLQLYLQQQQRLSVSEALQLTSNKQINSPKFDLQISFITKMSLCRNILYKIQIYPLKLSSTYLFRFLNNFFHYTASFL